MTKLKTLDKKLFFSICEKEFKGNKFQFVNHNGGVAILPILPNGDIVMIKQYRYSLDDEIFEIPAGKIEVNENNTLEVAIRELNEETGYASDDISYIGESYIQKEFTDEIIYYYIARDIYKAEKRLEMDFDEEIKLYTFKIDEVIEMIKNNTIIDGKTIYILCKYIKELNERKKSKNSNYESI